MSAFQRKGTVSKPSGPTHIHSYALRGVPVKYQPPIFVPDLIHLPAGWRLPTLPSESSFGYGYSREKWVLEQARVRTLSLVAEAEASEKQTRQQHEDDTTPTSEEPPPQPLPRPPIFSSTILTPTPVAGTTPTTTSTQPSGSQYDSSGAIRSLGQLSIREFEGDNLDPFELTTLKAINDMEVLQSVLQPTASVPAVTSAAIAMTSSPPVKSASSPALAQTASSTVPTVQSVPQGPGAAPSTSQASVVQPRTSVHQQASQALPMGVSGGLDDLFTVPTSVGSPGPTFLPQSTLQTSPLTNPFLSSPVFAPAITGSTGLTSTTTSNNPFSQGALPQPVPVARVGGVSPTNPFLPRESAVSSPPVGVAGGGASAQEEPGVGTLIDIGTEPLPQPGPVVSQLPPPYGSIVGQPASAHTNLPAAATPISIPNGPVHPHRGPSLATSPPVLPPKPQDMRRRTNPAPYSGAGGSAPSVPSVHARADALLAKLPSVPNRPGLGIPVLPPITQPTTSVSSHVPALPPPPVPAPRRHTPPPPYFPDQPPPAAHSPTPTPRARGYRLPDPQPSLTSKEKAEVQSIAGMGFPLARVARAVQKFGTQDRTKVLDFLIQVGKLEEEGYNGDSAETALVANNQDDEKAVTYLQKMTGYVSMGFQEKAIHEACEQAGGDWDQVLDILTQES